jgi:DNA mismatch repair protein MutS2
MNITNSNTVQDIVNKLPVTIFFEEIPDRKQALKYIEWLYSNKPDSKLVDQDKFFREVISKELRLVSMKIIEIENSKRIKISSKEVKAISDKKKEVIQEVSEKVEIIRAEKKEKKLKVNLVIEKPKPVLKVGDRVRMYDGKSIGTIDKIEKNKAIIKVMTTCEVWPG